MKKLIFFAALAATTLAGCATTPQQDITPTTTRWIDNIYVTPPSCPATICPATTTKEM
jgi:hypothetical protein